MRDAGVRVGLGVGRSASNNACNDPEACQAMLLQRVTNGADAIRSRETLELVTRVGQIF